MCAQTLVEAGEKVLLIDAGVKTEIEDPGWTKNFYDIRKTNDSQQEIFLGKNMELLHLETGEAFSQMTPQRRYILQDTKSVRPVSSQNFVPLETFATGGLGNAWGLGCFTFSDAELWNVKLDTLKIKNAYQVIADRIGISYSPDDILRYTAADLHSLQPGIQIDSNASGIMKRYYSSRKRINRKSFYAGVPAMALLTEQKENRKATDYTNMDFYYNYGHSAYRPSLTIKKLQSYRNFVHQRGVMVSSFEEHENIMRLIGTNLNDHQPVTYYCRKLVLACNVFGTARIVLQSSQQFNRKLPLLCNPYSMLATLQISKLGKQPTVRKTSTAQVCLFYDEDGNHANVPMASLYSYSSLLLFRLLKKSPLNSRDSLRILKYLQSALVVAGIHHPSTPSDSRSISLAENGILKIDYSDSPAEILQMQKVEKRFSRLLRQLGCFPFQKTTPPPGSSAHYAGPLPFSEKEEPFTLSSNGKLAGTQNVFVADASGFHFLPAKGPTLTIMANAHNIARHIIDK
jgi:hypothetical protein